jgi:hypothetical protein
MPIETVQPLEGERWKTEYTAFPSSVRVTP